MSWFKHLRLTFQLGLAFLVLALVVAFVGITGTLGLGRVQASSDRIRVQAAGALIDLNTITGRYQRWRLNLAKFPEERDSAALQKASGKCRTFMKEAQDAADRFARLVPGDDTKRMGLLLDQAERAAEPIVSGKLLGDPAAERSLINGELQKIADQFNPILDKITAETEAKAEALGAEGQAVAAQSTRRMDIAVAVGCLAAIAFGLLVTRVIKGQVGGEPRLAAEVAGRIARGDLEVSIPLADGDRTSMMASIRTMVDAIQALAEDACTLSRAAAVGRLSVRTEATRHQGSFRAIVEGMNETMERLGFFLDQLPSPVAIMDTDFNVLYINEIGARLGGRTPGQVAAGMKCFEQFRSDDCRTERCACARALRLGSPAASETVARPAQGLALDVSYSGIPIKAADGTVVGVFEVVTDQTRLKGAVREVARVMACMEQGDLTARVSIDADGEFRKLQDAVNNTSVKLGEIMARVRDASGMLLSASGQLSATAQSLSQGASEQAASVEETSASMEEMSASIAQNTENARLTGDLAARTSGESMEGGNAVRETVSAMQQIARKIAIIDDIAYQTNLLALNAAIEAGRAGEHGRGFAVVAAEVRKLAERSQVAAEEISRLSGSSVALAERAGTLLESIVPSVKKTSDLVMEIASASSEQSTGVSQIDGALTQISQAVQQNAAASEELASTAEEVSAQAMELKAMMDFFTLASGPERPAPSSRIPSSARPGTRAPSRGMPPAPNDPTLARV
jgi:methyl-accepting chemotaxis protein